MGNIISGELTDQPDYMSLSMVKTLLASGNEIASHSVTHPDLATVSQAALVQEMSQPGHPPARRRGAGH